MVGYLIVTLPSCIWDEIEQRPEFDWFERILCGLQSSKGEWDSLPGYVYSIRPC